MRALVLLCALTAGCDNMVKQPRYDAYGQSKLFADNKVMQAPPTGVVARDAAQWRADEQRPAMSAALLMRGQERFGIYCAMCHGADGSGQGSVTARGFPRPADFRTPRQRALSGDQLYRTVSQGHGTMYGFADRVPAPDRWAIAAYVEALRRSGR